MRALRQGYGRTADSGSGESAGRPAAAPLSGAWIQRIQHAAAPRTDAADHAQVQRAALELGINSPAEPLEQGLRTEMEQRFGGADFSGALVHKGPQARESAAVLEAKAFTSGPHIVVGGELTKKDWAHELAHFEDQQLGPVPGTDNGAGVSMSSSDDSGERHAEHKADQVMGGPAPVQRSAAVPDRDDRSPSGQGPTVQRLHVIKAGSAEYPTKHPDSEDFFVGQEKNKERSWFDERSASAPPKPHLVYKGEVDLAVSDAFDLAVEHAGAGQEPKTFFATDKQFSDSVKKLPGAHKGRGLSLSKTGRYLTIDGAGRKVTLYEIEPKFRKEKGGDKTKGLDVLVPQRCNEMLGLVTGKYAMARAADSQYWDVLEKFLVRLEPEGGWKGKFQEAMARGGEGDSQSYLEITYAMSGRFQHLVQQDAAKAEAVLKELGINKHAPTPNVGDGMTTMAQPDANQAESMADSVPFHFGGAIAKSGKDYITMENYYREQHEDSVSTISRNDPLWYFRMYGQEAGRTWHEGWTGGGTTFLGATITLTLRR
ncbi:eCIS core domain-containing protein [Streptacidiphilus cavernicola]|uniref:DUF4157 domain-containing protein n=1 Tax=Streptacidiphilus cavernicola TaxID=3342716 RepID=A0ABV6W4X1_9ACTN